MLDGDAGVLEVEPLIGRSWGPLLDAELSAVAAVEPTALPYRNDG